MKFLSVICNSVICFFVICNLLFVISASALQIDVGPVSNVTRTTAIPYATLSSTNGTTNAVNLVLYYGISDGSTNAGYWGSSNVTSSVTSAPPVTITNALSALAPASQYYCRWYAIEGTNRAWSVGTNFSTLAGVPTNAPIVPVYMPVMQTSNGVVVSPTNLASANGLATTNDSASLQAQVSSNDTDISSLQLQVSSNDTDISSLQLQVGSNDVDISSAMLQISSNDTDISSLHLQVASNDTDIADIQTNINSQVQQVQQYTRTTVSNWYEYPAYSNIKLYNDSMTWGGGTIEAKDTGYILAMAAERTSDTDYGPGILALGTNYSSAAERGDLNLVAGGYDGYSAAARTGRIRFRQASSSPTSDDPMAEIGTNGNWNFYGHALLNFTCDTPTATNHSANKLYIDNKFSGAKSVTNSWLDANSITNQQTFINGLLTSWSTNGVEL